MIKIDTAESHPTPSAYITHNATLELLEHAERPAPRRQSGVRVFYLFPVNSSLQNMQT